mmetsp:Transcript_115232/g.246248  ORF Transcript_115232/g.246248 Transcript_115232/m.246248 type:complete len:143 (-) Transcript_115232:79-507(-)
MFGRVLLVAALLAAPAVAFVPAAAPAVQPLRLGAAPRIAAPGAALGASEAAFPIEVEAEEASAVPATACLLAGLGLGYAAAVAGAAKKGRVAMKAEGKPAIAAARTPVAYPIFTFRWLAVHALAVPTVFFLGAISSMQFIQR